MNKTINTDGNKARRLNETYTAKGDLDTVRSTAFSPMCTHIQMHDNQTLMDHFSGIPNLADLKKMMIEHLARFFHDCPAFLRVISHMTRPWERARHLFNQPNSVTRVCRRLGVSLVYHPIEITEDALDYFIDPPQMRGEDEDVDTVTVTNTVSDGNGGKAQHTSPPEGDTSGPGAPPEATDVGPSPSTKSASAAGEVLATVLTESADDDNINAPIPDLLCPVRGGRRGRQQRHHV